MEPKYKKLNLEQLQKAISVLIYNLLSNIDNSTETLDADMLYELLEQLAGPSYIVATKIRNDIELSDDDKKYLCTLLTQAHKDE